jgi:hypothetical protein
MIQRKRWKDIKNGDIFFHAGTGWISRKIRKITGSKWSHCGFAWLPPESVEKIIDGETYIYLANERWTIEALNTIEASLLSTYEKDFEIGDLIVYGWPEGTRQECVDALMRYISSKLGQPYDWAGSAMLAVSIPINRLFEILGLDIVFPSPVRTKAQKCSELVLDGIHWLYKTTGDDRLSKILERVVDRENCTPAELARLMQLRPRLLTNAKKSGSL